MLIVHVHVYVKTESMAGFISATLDNARASLREPGIARFDVLQDPVDPAHFILNEVYRTEDAPAAHKQTDHYARWRDAVAEMMAQPRRAERFVNLFPQDSEY